MHRDQLKNLLLAIKDHESVPIERVLADLRRIMPQAAAECRQAGMAAGAAEAFVLKIANSLLEKYQFLNRHEHLLGKPYALIVDPSNKCPLHCHGCLHNKTFQQKIQPDWPLSLLDKKTFDDFIDQYGPFATTILFYNWGEPLLNPETPNFIHQAKSYFLETSLSTNLSIRFDAEDLVRSGLDYMIISLDGATPATYNRYRRGGDFDLVIHNIKRLVAAKKKHNLATPRLSWQFLLFEHNKHEMEQARKMATELGVNDIRFAIPYDVIWEEDLTPAKGIKEETYTVPAPIGGTSQVVTPPAPRFFDLITGEWARVPPDIDKTALRQRTGPTCQWLYSTLVMDACGRCLPCCYAPRLHSGYTWVFADQPTADAFNTPYHCFARKHFVWLSELKMEKGVAPSLPENAKVPYCVACPDRNAPPIVSDFHTQRYFRRHDSSGLLTDQDIQVIANRKPPQEKAQ